MHFLNLVELPVDLFWRIVLHSSAAPVPARSPDVIQRTIPVRQVAPDNLTNDVTVLLREPTPWAIPREYHLVQQRQAVVPVHDERSTTKGELVPECGDLALENSVFVVEVRNVRHHEMEVYFLPVRSISFRSYVTNNLLQPA